MRGDALSLRIGKRAARLMTVVAFPSIVFPGCPSPKELRRTNILPYPAEAAGFEYATRVRPNSEKMISLIQSL